MKTQHFLNAAHGRNPKVASCVSDQLIVIRNPELVWSQKLGRVGPD